MKSLKAALNVFVTQATKSVGLYTAFTGIFFYYAVFDKDFECTCKDQTILCLVNMIMPVLIILVMLLWFDGSFQALLKYSCLKWTCRFWCFLLLCISRAFFVSLLWPISVMIDGDWYVCCGHEKKLNCNKLNLTAEDQAIIETLKMKSRIYGFGVLLGIVFVAAIWRCVPWMECCTWCLKKCCTDESNDPTANSESKCLNKDELFKNTVLEVGESLVKNKLIEVAKAQIDQKIDAYVDKKQWGKCYDVVKEIIEELSQHDDSTDPTNPVPTNTDPPPGGSPSAEGGRNDDEIQLMDQPPSHGSPSDSSPNDDAEEDITDQPSDRLLSDSSPDEAQSSS